MSKGPWISAAVEQDVLADDIARVHAAQEGAHGAEFLRRPVAARRVGLLARVPRLLERLSGGLGARLHRGIEPIGLEMSRQHVVDRYAVTRDFSRESRREPGETAARAIRQAQHRNGRLYRARGDVHDTT